jgi:ferredoxin
MIVNITNECISCGKCVEICPDVFEMGDDIARVIQTPVPPEYEDAAEQAAEECPVNAILINP